MTKAKTFTEASLVPEGEFSGPSGAKAEDLLRFMRSSPATHDLIPESMTKAPVGVVESASDAGLMQRIAVAFTHELQKASKAGRDLDIKKVLKEADVPLEVYIQAVAHPDWREISSRVYEALVVEPQRAVILTAMVKSASAGDVAAAKFVETFLASGDTTLEDQMRALEREGDEAVAREASRLLLELNGLVEQNRVEEAPEALVEEAAGDVSVQHARPEPEIKLDLSEWTDADG